MSVISDSVKKNAFLHAHYWQDEVLILVFVTRATNEHVGGLEYERHVTDKMWPNVLPFPRIPAIDIIVMAIAETCQSDS